METWAIITAVILWALIPIFYVLFEFNPLFKVIISMILFVLGFLILVLDYNTSSKNKEKQVLKQSDNALDILKTRYAKGEITEQEFENMKKKLED